jgi:hypothetical protein
MRSNPSWARLLVAVMTLATLAALIFALAAPYHEAN